MNNKTKRNLIILVILGGVAWWYMPTLQGIAAARPQPQPLYIAPAPQAQPISPAQPVTIQQPQPAPAPIEPAQVIIMPTAMPQPTQAPQQPQPVIIDAVPTRDWAPEIKAVNANLDNAIKIVEACAIEKAKGALQVPVPKIIDCSMTVENLERAKEKVLELQQAISDYNEVNQ